MNMHSNHNVLVFGISGMLGHIVFDVLSQDKSLNVYGTSRNAMESKRSENIIRGVDVDNYDSIVEAFNIAKPNIVINCIGLIKQLKSAKDPLNVLPINAMLPHRLAKLSMSCGAKFIHYSTDCVFSGKKGDYLEDDTSDCVDLYGKSKYIGEVDYPNSITLRTSLIGHEINSRNSLIEWFLSQDSKVSGFTKAIFSGFTAYEHAKILRDFVIPNTKLQGLYHLAANPINKYDLLCLVAKIYDKKIDIIASDEFKIDRSLNGKKFYNEAGYTPPSWEKLIEEMHNYTKKAHYVSE